MINEFTSKHFLPLGYLGVGWMADAIGGIITINIFPIAAILVVFVVLSVPSIRRFD